MPVAFDAATTLAGTPSSSSATFSHTCTGSERLLIVGVGVEWFGVTVSGVTYAGVPMDPIYNANYQTFYGHAMFSLVAPATGANNVVVTMTGTADRITGGAISFTGVNQTTPLNSVVTNTGIASDPSQTAPGTVTSDDMVVDHCSANDPVDGIGAIVVGADQTERVRTPTGSTASLMSTQPGSAGGLMSWTEPNNGFAWGHGAIVVKASGVQPTYATDTLVLADQAVKNVELFLMPGPPSVIAKVYRKVGVLN